LTPQSVAGAVINSDKSSVLLIQRRDVPVWALPGGGVELNETPEEAIIREISEETGLNVMISRLVGIYTPINKLAKYTYLYECMVLNGKLATSSETRDVQFFPVESLPKLIPPPYREWISDTMIGGDPLHKKIHSVNYLTLFKNVFLHPTLVFRFLLARLGLPINR
jgi:ADP-ribose pyrophosphatase YjhB (NUDIX family)